MDFPPRTIPLKKTKKAQYWQDVSDTLTWYEQRNVDKATIRKLFRQHLRKNIKHEKTRSEKINKLNMRLRKL